MDEFLVMLRELDAEKAGAISQAGIVTEIIRIILNNPCALKIKHAGKADKITEYLRASSIGVVLFNHHFECSYG